MFTQLRGNIIKDQGLLSLTINNLAFSHFSKRKVNNESINTDYHQPFYFSQLDIQLRNNHEFLKSRIAKKPKDSYTVLGIK